MKKITLIISIVFALMLAVGVAAPIIAADPGRSLQPAAQVVSECSRAGILAKLLLIQDETRVDALLAGAVENGRITGEQSEKIKAFWTLNHERAAKKLILGSLNRIQDEARLMKVVNTALERGRITQEQADKIVAAWHKLHD